MVGRGHRRRAVQSGAAEKEKAGGCQISGAAARGSSQESHLVPAQQLVRAAGLARGPGEERGGHPSATRPGKVGSRSVSIFLFEFISFFVRAIGMTACFVQLVQGV